MRRVLILAVALLAGCGPAGTGASAIASGASQPPVTLVTMRPVTEASPGTMSFVDAVNAEAGLYPEDYCGRYQNSDFNPGLPNGAFVSMWRANLHTHAAHIRALADGTEQLVFVGCTYAYVELLRLSDELASPDAMAWLATIPAAELSGGPDEIMNRVDLSISSAVPDAVDRVTAHFVAAYQLPPGILHVWSDGNGAALRPWGTVHVTVLGTDGRPIGPNQLGLEWHGELENLRCGRGDVGYGVAADGSAIALPCQAGQWTIVVVANDIVYGSGVITVKGTASVDLTIRLTSAPPRG